MVEEIRKAGGSALAVAGDVGADDFPEKVVSATIKEYGKINHIVNNGILILFNSYCCLADALIW